MILILIKFVFNLFSCLFVFSLGVLYNVALIFFTGSYLINVTWEFRWICFILTEHACMIVKYVWEEMSSEVTEETRIQLER